MQKPKKVTGPLETTHHLVLKHLRLCLFLFLKMRPLLSFGCRDPGTWQEWAPKEVLWVLPRCLFISVPRGLGLPLSAHLPPPTHSFLTVSSRAGKELSSDLQ